ncbi:hypothetical protein P43SY_010766 [Pythium insidiosum]|uniref:HAT C-terminal dimerisation domain-containing protein n=1 Tax=Pythium insidiosum TaxID=114742 RepID=A0AAD5LQ90_PYTIN|nr:hypothetical protein P43SY_010766 [Pythium insidiosum]
MQIREVIPRLERIDERIIDFVPTPRENAKLKGLYEDLKNLESVNKRLQQDHEVSLSDVRLLFAHVVEHYPTTGKYLQPTAAVVKFPDFENGVVKILNDDMRHLTRQERAAVAKLLEPAVTTDSAASSATEKPRESFADAALSRSKTREATPRVDLQWIPATSNDVERLFSRAGLVYSSLRRAMNPATLETIMFLSFNRTWWDASAVAQGIEAKKVRKRQRPAV